jgi:flagellar biosynthesis/type III secretory pathway protein FliH
MLTNEQIARLIVDAYNVGKADGYDLGYDAGESDGIEEAHEAGYDEGYADARDEFEVVVEVDEESDEESEEMSSAQIYDAGWNDGYEGNEPLYGLAEDKVYLWGYKDGKKARKQESK